MVRIVNCNLDSGLQAPNFGGFEGRQRLPAAKPTFAQKHEVILFINGANGGGGQ